MFYGILRFQLYNLHVTRKKLSKKTMVTNGINITIQTYILYIVYIHQIYIYTYNNFLLKLQTERQFQ